jgi:hypothetical protein
MLKIQPTTESQAFLRSDRKSKTKDTQMKIRRARGLFMGRGKREGYRERDWR